MRRLSILLLALGLTCSAHAEVWQARYGVAETFDFKLYNADGTLDVDEADGGTEVSLACNEGTETTATNDFVDEGTFYSIALTATEMQCERIAIVVAATTTEVFFVQTSANASAMTPAYDANVTQWLGTAAATPTVAGVPEVDLTHWIGTAAATPTVAGVPEVDITHFGGTAGTFASGRAEVNTSHWGGTAVASARPLVDTVLVSGDSNAADNLELAFDDTAGAAPWTGITDQGTAQSAASTTLVLRAATPFGADNVPIGSTLWAFGSTQGYWQVRSITDYATASDTATVEAWDVTPSGTITYKIWGTATAVGAGGLDAAGVRAAVGLASANLDTQLGAIDDAVDTEVGAIKTKTDFLPSATAGAAGGVFIAGTNAATTITTALTTTFTGNLTGSAASVTGAVGSVTGSVGSVAAGGITAASLAADTITAAKVASDVSTEIWALSCSEPSAKPAWGATNLQGWICWIGAWSRNEINQTSNTKTLRNDADSGNLVTCTVSDDGTTFAVQECSP